ncbi:MAG: hypothetical protein Q7R49_01755 [Candidatus Daviesbacteria bacterium]|nr:hypothetical protein [Candidatus Daviesbacteria bacterium]
MLESLDQVNIGSINLEEPKKLVGREFDVVGVLTRQDWNKIKNAIPKLKKQHQTENENYGDFMKAVFSLNVLSPGEAHRFKVDDDLLGNGENLENWTYLKLSFPEVFKNLTQKKGQTLEEAKQNLYRHIRSLGNFANSRPWYVGDDNKVNVPRSLLEAKVLFPAAVSQPIIDFFVPNMIATLKPVSVSSRPNQYLENWLRNASILRMLSPVNIDEKFVSVTDWNILKSQILNLRGNNFFGDLTRFTNMAASMRILSAEEVKITDQGLELIMPRPQEFVQNIPSIPEVRKF